MNTLNRLFNKPAYRVTRYGTGFDLHRRFLRFFYRPVSFFLTLDDVYQYIHRTTGSDSICVELYPPGDFSTPLSRDFFQNDVRSVMSSGCSTGPRHVASAATGPRHVCGPTGAMAPATHDNSLLLLTAAVLLSSDNNAKSEQPAPSTDVPLEAPAPEPSCPCDSSPSYDSSPSCDSGSSSCDSGSSSCDSGGGY